MNQNTVQSNSTVLSSLQLTAAPTISRCENGWNWHPQPFENCVFRLILEGEGELQIESRRVALFGGSSFLFAPGSVPRATQNEANPLRIFGFSFSGFPEAATQEHKVRDIAWFEKSAHYAIAAWHNVEGEEAAKRVAAQHIIAAIVAQWQIERAQLWPSPRMQEIVEIVREIRESPGQRWLVGDLCARTNLSPTQFTRRFAEHTGASPAHFVVTTRIERAKQLLRETDMTIAAISQSLGYHDVHFFCRQFKLFTATTPGSLRK